MTVSTTSIPVLHSVEVAHLYPQVMLPICQGIATSQTPLPRRRGKIEREMCPWAISKYFGDWVSTQVLKCESMPMDEQSENLEQRYVSKS
jgi:hypothetical protein